MNFLPTNNRKKRNIKALQLPLSPIDPKPSRNAPAPSAKRRNVILDSARLGLGSAATVNNSALLTPESSTTQRRNLHRTLTNTLERLKGAKSEGDGVLDGPLRQEDLKNLAELGMGNGGSVMKVEHVPSGLIMAKKVVFYLCCSLKILIIHSGCSHRRKSLPPQTASP